MTEKTQPITTAAGIFITVVVLIVLVVLISIPMCLNNNFNKNAIASTVVEAKCGKAQGFGNGTACRVLLKDSTRCTVRAIVIKGDTVFHYKNRCRMDLY